MVEPITLFFMQTIFWEVVFMGGDILQDTSEFLAADVE